jgi:hypothetical protein
MSPDYIQVLSDLDEQIAFHKRELEELQAARPAIVALRDKVAPVMKAKYVGMGATAAIRDLLSKSNAWYGTFEVLDHLVARGWSTESSDPAKVVASTLSQMKAAGFIEGEHSMWRWRPIRIVPLNVQATAPTVFDHPSEQ